MRRRARSLVACAVAGASLAVIADPVEASFPGANGRIAFVGADGGIWDVAPNGRGRRRLVAPLRAGPVETLGFSPSGRTLAFMAPGDYVATVPSNGGRPRRITPFLTLTTQGVGFLPSGQEIAYVDRRAGTAWAVPIRGPYRKRRRLRGIPGDAHLPQWSARGDVVFERVSGDVHDFDIYAVYRGTSQSRRLTFSRDAETPSWTPDGRHIYYTRLRKAGIYVMDADGSDKRRVRVRRASSPVVSPNGKRVAYQTHSEDHGPFINVMRTDGTHRTRVAEGNSPAWQPRPRP